MAFTLTEQTAIRDYLGWTAKYQQFDSGLERAFSFIANLTSGGDSSVEDQVRALLVKVQTIETEVDAARPRFKADQVGTIKLNRMEIKQLANAAKIYIGRMARLLGVEVRGDAFAADLTKGYETPWGPSTGGNAQRHG